MCRAPNGGFVVYRGVAQFGSAPALGAGGPGFESRLPDHSAYKNLAAIRGVFLFGRFQMETDLNMMASAAPPPTGSSER
jgi:hypothetical protein